jgi:uncharacterized protein
MSLNPKLVDLVHRHIDGYHDKCHDSNHLKRVVKLANTIIEHDYPNILVTDKSIVLVIALAHETEDHKLLGIPNDSGVTLEQIWNTLTFCYGSENAAFIRAMTGRVSWSWQRKHEAKEDTVPPLHLMIVRDADRLEAIGAIGFWRATSYTERVGGHVRDVIDHYHEKLCKIADQLYSPHARAVGQVRHARLERIVSELEDELA